MSLFGSCEDCGSAARLRHKPDVPLDEQSRPSVCARCRDQREEILRGISDVRDRGIGPIELEYEMEYETSDSEEDDRDE